MKKVPPGIHLLLAALMLCLPLGRVYAEYVLPYPSAMPGNKLYRVSRLMDTFKRYWHFGTLGQIKYRMQLADKYLVEAKTLFEYKQYSLANDALIRSRAEAAPLAELVGNLVGQGKDPSQVRTLVCGQSAVHTAILTSMRATLPQTFLWEDENKEAKVIPIRKSIEDALGTAGETASRLHCP